MKSETANSDTAHRVTSRRSALDAPVVDELIHFLEPNPKFDDVLHLAMACYIHERLIALVDLAIEAFDDVATGMYRRSESDRDEDVRRRAPAVNHKLRMFGDVVGVVLDPEIPDGAVREHVFETISREELARAHSESNELIRPEDCNCFEYLGRRYTYVRSFFPRFLRVIQFEGTAAARPLLDAVPALNYWNAEQIRKLPASAPIDWVPTKWRPSVLPSGENIDRHY